MKLKKLVISAMFLALAYVLPFATGQIRDIGNMLCPMHLPVILCGFICGWQWAMPIGFCAPLLRSLTLGMPPVFPRGISMALELAAYGLLSGVLYRIFPKKKIFIYFSLILSMIGGRIIWGISRYICAGLTNTTFPIEAFWTGAVTEAIPGIIIQIILIPILVMIYEKIEIKSNR